MEMGRRQRVTKGRKGVSGEARRVATDGRSATRGCDVQQSERKSKMRVFGSFSVMFVYH